MHRIGALNRFLGDLQLSAETKRAAVCVGMLIVATPGYSGAKLIRQLPGGKRGR